MSFREMVGADVLGVFLNTSEFAEVRTVVYGGVPYEGVPVVITRDMQGDRGPRVEDHAQGLFRDSCVMHCSAEAFGGAAPENGQRLMLSDAGGGGFLSEYCVSGCSRSMGALRVSLEALDE